MLFWCDFQHASNKKIQAQHVILLILYYFIKQSAVEDEQNFFFFKNLQMNQEEKA